MPQFDIKKPDSLTFLQINSDEGIKYLELSISPHNKNILKQLTIGRTHDNMIQILNNTISKKHATITLANQKHYLTDLQSVNGTLLNGKKISKGKATILTDNDQIQFGKFQTLYKYRDLRQSKSKNKGKINLKDYLFQPNQQKNTDQPVNTVPKEFLPTKKQRRRHKEQKIRIPDITDYLKLDYEQNKPTNQNTHQQQYNSNKTFIRQPITQSSKPKQSKINLTKFNQDNFLDQEDEKYFQISKKQKNIYLQQQQAKRLLEQKQRAIKQNQIKMEVERAKVSEDLLQKQLLLSEKVRVEQQQLKKQRQRLQNQFIEKQRRKRQQQMKNIQQMEQKQKQLRQKIQQQRRNQIKQLEQKQLRAQQQSEMQYKAEYQRRKHQLEMQAAALAQNYQKIYRDTIQKVRTQIDNQQQTIRRMQEKQQILAKQNQQIGIQIQRVKQKLSISKQKFIKIHGRNKAYILYASQLQNRIDGLQLQQKHKNDGYYKPSKQSAASEMGKIKQSIASSRRLLKIKKQQYDALFDELKAIKGAIKSETLNVSNLGDVTNYLDTMVENMIEIENLKNEYLQQIQSERGIETLWQLQIEQFNQYFDRIRVHEAEMNKNARQIDENIRDQIKKSTEQRLHLLKALHYCSEQKKSAAKFLIEQMVGIQQQIHGYLSQNQNYHNKIVKIITQSQKNKRQNELLGQILFGQDENGHHFDNMKAVINNLIQKLQDQRVGYSVENCMKLSDEGMKTQIKIQQQLDKKKKIQQNFRKISQLGINSERASSDKKNPLIFFGDLLTKKQLQVQSKKATITNLNSENQLIREQIKLLQQKKAKISDNLQRFKKQQLLEAKKYLNQ